MQSTCKRELSMKCHRCKEKYFNLIYETDLPEDDIPIILCKKCLDKLINHNHIIRDNY